MSLLLLLRASTPQSVVKVINETVNLSETTPKVLTRSVIQASVTSVIVLNSPLAVGTGIIVTYSKKAVVVTYSTKDVTGKI
jgi:hypothetical protein